MSGTKRCREIAPDDDGGGDGGDDDDVDDDDDGGGGGAAAAFTAVTQQGADAPVHGAPVPVPGRGPLAMVALHQARVDAALAARCGGAARAVSLPEVAVWTAEDEALLTGWLEARAQACTTRCAEVHGMDLGTAQEEARVEYLAEGRRAYWRSYMSENPVLKAQLREGSGGGSGGGAAGARCRAAGLYGAD